MRWKQNIPGKLGKYNSCWCPGSLCRQVTNNHDMVCVRETGPWLSLVLYVSWNKSSPTRVKDSQMDLRERGAREWCGQPCVCMWPPGAELRRPKWGEAAWRARWWFRFEWSDYVSGRNVFLAGTNLTSLGATRKAVRMGRWRAAAGKVCWFFSCKGKYWTLEHTVLWRLSCQLLWMTGGTRGTVIQHNLHRWAKLELSSFCRIFHTGFTRSCHLDNFQCSKWRKFCQNTISVWVNSLHSLLMCLLNQITDGKSQYDLLHFLM